MVICLILTVLHLVEFLCTLKISDYVSGLMYICSWISQVGKSILLPKELPESFSALWCEYLQSVCSFGWGTRCCGCFPFTGLFIFWDPNSLTNLDETKTYPQFLWRTVLLFTNTWWFFHGRIIHPMEINLAWPETCPWNVGRKDVYYLWDRSFQSQSLLVYSSFCLHTHTVTVCWKNTNEREKTQFRRWDS